MTTHTVRCTTKLWRGNHLSQSDEDGCEPEKKKQRTRINIGVALPKWMSVMVASGFQSNTEVAFIVRSVRESVFSRFDNEYFKKVVTLSTFAHAQM